MRPPRVAALALALALALVARGSAAHTLGLSMGEYRADGRSVRATLTFARAELAALVPALDANRDGHVTAIEVSDARDLLRARLLDRIHVTSGTACPARILDVGLVEGDGVLVKGAWDCAPGGDAPFVIDLALLDDLAPGHRHVAGERLLVGDERSLVLPRTPEAVPADAAEPSPRPAPAPPFGALLVAGIEHILTGYDHLVFLLGLVLVRARVRSLLALVTAFTAGHSLTLSLAVLGLWSPGTRLVEAAIALSVAYVGIENFFVRDGARRWRITLPFGLVHGFGFAGALQAIALPRALLPAALVAFNLGVEAGQLAVLGLVVPLIVVLRRRPWFEVRVVPIVSGLIAVAGAAWFVARLAG